MIIGVFGGTFDPPHIGHLILAEEAYFQLGLSFVLWAPASSPPHKTRKKITPVQYRVELVRRAIAGNDQFVLSDVDICRPSPHYAVDTIRLLQKKYPKSNIIYLMGGDSLKNLCEWYKPKELISNCSALGVMHRPREMFDIDFLEDQIPGLKEKVRYIETPLIDISASKIRSKVKDGCAYRYYLPESVYHFVERENLYR